MYYKSLLISALSLIGSVSAGSVKELTPSNFDDIVFSGTPSLVEFFAPWCGHCKKLAPIYEELASTLSHAASKVHIASVDGDEHKELSQKYGISGFPTLKWFDGKSKDPVNYEGGRELDALQAFIAEKTGARAKTKAKAPSQVQMLTDSTFAKTIGGDKHVFVAFTATWCGHCKSLAPTWETLANDFSSEPNVTIAKVDAEANRAIAETYGVKGFPTLKFFPAGSTTPLDYNGGRDEKTFVEYLNQQAGTHRTVGGGLDFSAGTIEALDQLVAKVTGGSSGIADLEGVAADVKAAAGALKDKYAEYYVKVLEKLSGNAGYLEKEVARLEGLLKKGGLARAKADDLTRRYNILKRFGLGGAGGDDVEEETEGKEEL